MNTVQLKNTLPTVAIFGRTNVGKSTLFNRLSDSHQALISDIAGTTRDANYATVSWTGRQFQLIDTGGLMDLKFLTDKKAQAETIDEEVQKQVRRLIQAADVVLFVVDNKAGLLAEDKKIALILKRLMQDDNKIILVANKVDERKQAAAAGDFFKLGWGEPQLISASTGSGTGDLLDVILEKLKEIKKEAPAEENKLEDDERDSRIRGNDSATFRDDKFNAWEDNKISVCLLGKPNVGKSSLLNAILGYKRVIVSPLEHTTREPQDTDIIYNEREIKIIDTAGISKHGHDRETLEKAGIRKTLTVLGQADIVLLVLDVSEPITHQDAKLVEEIFERKKSLIIIGNKWDLVEEHDSKKYEQMIYSELPFAHFVPIKLISAKNRARVNNIMDLILEIDAQRRLSISDSQLDKMLKSVVRRVRPTKGKGTRYPHIYEFKQLRTNPPRFMVRLGVNQSLAESYLKFLQNRLREKYGFVGTPLQISVIKTGLIKEDIKPEDEYGGKKTNNRPMHTGIKRKD